MDLFKPRRVIDCSFRAVSAATNGDSLLIGDGNGSLHVFRSSGGKLAEVTVVDKFARTRKAIHSLTAVAEWGLLLSLVDNSLCVNSLDSFGFRGKIADTKGATCFVVATNACLIFVSVKRKFLVLAWTGKDFVCVNSFSFPDPVTSLCFSRDYVVASLKTDYVLIDYQQGIIARSLFPFGTGRPRVLSIRNGRYGEEQGEPESLLVQEDKGYFHSSQGLPTRSGGEVLEWDSQPVAMISVPPFIVSATVDAVYVHNALTTRLLERLPLDGILDISDGGGGGNPQSVRRCAPELETRTGDTVFVLAGGGKSVLQLDVPPVEKIVEILQRRKGPMFEEALSLCIFHKERIHPDLEKQLHMKYGYFLFRQPKFALEAYQQFLAAELPPRVVLSLTPEVLPRGVPLSHTPKNVQAFLGKLSVELLLAIVQYLRQVRCDYSLPGPPEIAATSETYRTPPLEDMRGVLDTSWLKAEVLLNERLNQQQKVSKMAASQPHTLHARTRSNLTVPGLPPVVGSNPRRDNILEIIRSENGLWIDEAVHLLRQAGVLDVLLELYRTKGMHVEACELLQEQIRSSRSDDVRRPLQWTLVRLLQNLGPSDEETVFRFARVVLLENVDIGVAAFTAKDHRISPQSVLAYFDCLNAEKSQPGAPPSNFDVGMATERYLTALIEECGVDAPHLHNAFARLFVEQLRACWEMEGRLGKTDRDEGRRRKIRARVVTLRHRLQSFLRKSKSVVPVVILGDLPENCWEERAVLLARLARHAEVLRIFVVELGNDAAGLEYCDRVYRLSQSSGIYMTFLQVFASELCGESEPVEKREEAFLRMLAIISSNPAHFEPVKALQLLPGEFSLFDSLTTLSSLLSHSSAAVRHSQRCEKLFELQALSKRHEYAEAVRKSVVVDESTKCRVCHKGIGTHAFQYKTTSGECVHVACGYSNSKPEEEG